MFIPSINIAKKLIFEQFPEFSHLTISDIEKQGHDNRTYKLGEDMLIRMPISEQYALKVPKEQELLPKLAKYLTITIPKPIKMGQPSTNYPYSFSIYKYLPGKSVNLVNLTNQENEALAVDLANFLKEMQAVKNIKLLAPGKHNFWRGAHVDVYDKNVREQIKVLDNIIDTENCLYLWDKACLTKWHKNPVWIHGDFAIGNILVKSGKLVSIIDFGGTATGDPACDLVIAWTYFLGKARDIFINEMNLDKDTFLRASAWAIWKATYELSNINNKKSNEAYMQKNIIQSVINWWC
jgi:aminoglycoside phosphotransferase (APT) family kinase protein